MYSKIKDRVPNFELHPVHVVDKTVSWGGYDEIVTELKGEIGSKNGDRTVVVFDYYHGIDEKGIFDNIISKLKADVLIDSSTIKYPEEIIYSKFEKFITEDRINGAFSFCKIDEFFDEKLVVETNEKINASTGLIVVYGVAASVITKGDILVYGNVTIQKIKSAYFNGFTNWGVDNPDEDPITKEKRFNFLEGRVQDVHKRKLFKEMDYVIDGENDNHLVMTTGEDYLKILEYFSKKPFKLEPFFNKGIWGGHWCQDVLNAEPELKNTAWGIIGWINQQCAVAKANNEEVHVPGRDIIAGNPVEFLGNQNFFWFGYNCPFGCDFLDTWGGQNLSLQVHPDIAYSNETFNSQFGHYETYYMLDTTEDSTVYLGTKEGVTKDELVEAFKEAQITGKFDDEKYINRIPMKTHDHIFIPSGAIHASGVDTLVLEINALCFQTFKLWDWDRVDLDGKPRPINIDHGAHVIQEKFQTEFVMDRLVSKQTEIDRGIGWRKEHSGTNDLELLTIDRYWFSKPIFLETKDHVKIIALVDGEEAIITSPNNEFEPIELHYAEAMFIPASCGQFIVKPFGRSEGKEIAILETYMNLGDDYS